MHRKRFYAGLTILVIISHLGFILLALFGSLLVVRWRAWAWLHVPVVLWAGLIEILDGTCPLTPLEKRLRAKAGLPVYHSGFIEHYLVPSGMAPQGSARPMHILMGVLVLVFNAAVYAWGWLAA